ncbi:MAG: thiamine-phosphate kinase, partial [Candidatus Rokuibacteriota bacterium]
LRDAGGRETVTAHLRPRPRVREAQWLAAAGGVTAMMDLSDGLATDLGRLAEESRVGARVQLSRLPIAASVHAVAATLGADALEWATGGGEDYELLMTCAAPTFEQLARGLAEATGTTLQAVGEVVPASVGVSFLDAGGTSVAVRAGYEHFVAGDRRG